MRRADGCFKITLRPGKTKTHYFSLEPHGDWAKSFGFPNSLILHGTVGTDRGLRPLRLTKTRAYVAVDENDNGTPKTEVWKIRGLIYYNW